MERDFCFTASDQSIGLGIHGFNKFLDINGFSLSTVVLIPDVLNSKQDLVSVEWEGNILDGIGTDLKVSLAHNI